MQTLAAELRRARAAVDQMRARMGEWKNALAMKIEDLDAFQASLEPSA